MLLTCWHIMLKSKGTQESLAYGISSLSFCINLSLSNQVIEFMCCQPRLISQLRVPIC